MKKGRGGRLKPAAQTPFEDCPCPFQESGCSIALLFGRRAQRAGGGIERLRQVGDDVVDMLDPH